MSGVRTLAQAVILVVAMRKDPNVRVRSFWSSYHDLVRLILALSGPARHVWFWARADILSVWQRRV